MGRDSKTCWPPGRRQRRSRARTPTHTRTLARPAQRAPSGDAAHANLVKLHVLDLHLIVDRVSHAWHPRPARHTAAPHTCIIASATRDLLKKVRDQVRGRILCAFLTCRSPTDYAHVPRHRAVRAGTCAARGPRPSAQCRSVLAARRAAARPRGARCSARSCSGRACARAWRCDAFPCDAATRRARRGAATRGRRVAVPNAAMRTAPALRGACARPMLLPSWLRCERVRSSFRLLREITGNARLVVVPRVLGRRRLSPQSRRCRSVRRAWMSTRYVCPASPCAPRPSAALTPALRVCPPSSAWVWLSVPARRSSPPCDCAAVAIPKCSSTSRSAGKVRGV